MRLFRFLLPLVLYFIVVSGHTTEISINEAKEIATNFLIERYNPNLNDFAKKDHLSEVFVKSFDDRNIYYTINYSSGGWVVISATDLVIPILAYSYIGKYNPDNEPDNFRAWMFQYSRQIIEAIEQNKIPDDYIKNKWKYYLSDDYHNLLDYKQGRSVEPLIVSNWDQGIFYNEMCPADPQGPGGHCYTGCVPTCMGQIANYFRWPETGVGEYSYDGGEYGTLSANFGESFYNWSEMPGNVTENNLETAEILYHLGVSCDLVYGPDGSGMYNHKAAYSLRTYFKYSPETEYLYRDSTDLDWDSVIIAHLDKKIPLYYAGWSVPNINGHAFVCDGYENDDYFHFNWGWSGSYNGYFYTDNLNPGGSNFNLAQELIINCFPDTANYQYPAYHTGVDTVTATMGTIDDGSGPVYNYLNNTNASWLISPNDSIINIELEFYKLSIAEGDTLYIYDGNSSTSPLIAKFSGYDVPEPISSSGTELYVQFITNNELTSEGFLFGYSCELPVYCIGNTFLTSPNGSLSDGSGDANYHNLSTCIWLISPGNDQNIFLDFTEFSTEADHDFVTIYDGSNQLGSFSGSELPPQLIGTAGNMMTLVFSTNSSVTDEGWSADYHTDFVGVNENNNNYHIYPNPADDMLIIEVQPDNDLQKTIILHNITGKVVYSDQGSKELRSSIVTSDLNEGMYILKIFSENLTYTKKILIKH